MSRALKIHLFAFLFFLLSPHILYQFLFTTPIGNDFLIIQPYPLLRFLAYLQEDCFILWNPGLFGGISESCFWAINQVLFPITCLYSLFLAAYEGQILFLFLHFKLFAMGLGGYFAFLFFAEVSRSWIAAGMGGLIFIFNFRMLDNLRYGVSVEILVLLPLVLWLLERMIQRGSPVYASFYAFVLGSIFLAGHPQHGIYNVLLITAYFFFRELFFKTPTIPISTYLKTRRNVWLLFGGFSFFAFCLASPLLLTVRNDVFPFLYQRTLGNFTDTHKMGGTSLLMNFCFPWLADVHSGFYSAMGTTLLMLFACVALYKEKLPRDTRYFLIFFLSFFVFALLYSLGSSAYVSTLTQILVPPLKFTRAHGRIMGAGVFCLSGIVVFFIQWLESALTQHQKPSFSFFKLGISFFCGTLFFCILFLSVALIGCFYWNIYDILYLETLPEIATRFLMILPLIFDEYTPVFIAIDPQMILIQFVAFVVFTGLTIALLQKILSENPKIRLLSYAGLTLLLLIETSFYHRKGTWILPKYPRFMSSTEFLGLDTYHNRIHPSHLFFYEPGLSSVFWSEGEVNFNVPHSLLDFIDCGGDSATTLYEDLKEGKLFVPQEYQIVSEMKTALAGKELRKCCVIEATEAERTHLKEFFKEVSPSESVQNSDWSYRSLQTTEKVTLQVIHYTPNEIRFRVQTQAPIVVNYLDLYHPNFIAEIDGNETQVLKTYGTFKGVLVPPGEHVVLIQYYPKVFFYSVRVALLSTAFLFLILFFSLLKSVLPRNKRFFGILLLVLFSFILAVLGVYADRTLYRLSYPPKTIQYSH
ncbi:MAG: hypothetical protein AABZ60_13590 [Planctomycetota bacterium]